MQSYEYDNAESFKNLMDDLHDAQIECEIEVAQEMGVDIHCATDIVYLRNRSRWTKQLEDKLIELHKAKMPPNIMEFGNES